MSVKPIGLDLPSEDHSFPLPRLVRRKLDGELESAALQDGHPEVVARVLGGRLIPPNVVLREFLDARIGVLDSPEKLKDMDEAATRVANAVTNGEVIGLESDYDQDGLGAMATLRLAFIEGFSHPEEKLRSYIGHRLRDGYGLCEPLADRILAEHPPPAVLITADNGSSDEDRIRRLAESGIDCIVTDHHAIPAEGPPKSAYACINPQQDGCKYPDRSIAGGMVAWLLMCAVRNRLVEQGLVSEQKNSLGTLLDFVACSTVADCVSMASLNNRALVKYGLRLMNKKPRQCWQGMKPLLKAKEIKAETISFGIAPRVNAQTRLNSADDALNFLLAKSVEDAKHYAGVLDGNNEERKSIERKMVDSAIDLATTQIANQSASVVTLIKDGHPGVQGICSSRILDRYGRPTFTYCPNVGDPDSLTGSGRSSGSMHLRDALQAIDDERPGLLVKFGGHSAAAGVSLESKNFDVFASAFEDEVRRRTMGLPRGPEQVSDGELSIECISLETLDSLQVLEPTGRGFEQAQFDGEFEVVALKAVGDGTHLKMQLRNGSMTIPAIWFRARRNSTAPLPVQRGDSGRFVYRLSDNNGYGRRRVELQVICLVESS